MFGNNTNYKRVGIVAFICGPFVWLVVIVAYIGFSLGWLASRIDVWMKRGEFFTPTDIEKYNKLKRYFTN